MVIDLLLPREFRLGLRAIGDHYVAWVITTRQVNPVVVLPVRVTIGGLEATILYAGEAPSAVAGLMQVGEASTVEGAA